LIHKSRESFVNLNRNYPDMSVQTGNRSTGYDPTATVSEQLSTANALLATHLANGRDGTAQVAAIRQRIVELQNIQANHQATQARVKAELAAQAAKCKGTVAPVAPSDNTIE
jgi:hypothetical protein